MSSTNQINNSNRIFAKLQDGNARQNAQAYRLISLSSVKNCSSTIGMAFVNTDALRLDAGFARERKTMTNLTVKSEFGVTGQVNSASVDDEIMHRVAYLEQSRAAGVLFDDKEINDIVGSSAPSQAQMTAQIEPSAYVRPSVIVRTRPSVIVGHPLSKQEKPEQAQEESEKAKRQSAKLEAQRKRQSDTAIGDALILSDRHEKHDLPIKRWAPTALYRQHTIYQNFDW